MAGSRGATAGRPRTVEVEGRTITLTNPDKVLYPSTGTRKDEVLDYYLAVAERLVGWARDRPATRKRWVHGVGTAEEPGQAFFTKQLERGAPSWVARRDIPHTERVITYPLVNDAATLAWLAQVDTLEIHVPQWRFGPDGEPDPPDRLVLDLDPGPGVGLPECVRVAREARAVLADMGLTATPVTSGSKGLHLYAGLPGTASSDEVSAVARALADALTQELPTLVVSEMRRSLRTGRVLLDWSQNNARKTTICPWSLRGRLVPTVAAPREWDELDDPGLAQLTMTDVLERLQRGPGHLDPVGLPAAARAVGESRPVDASPADDPPHPRTSPHARTSPRRHASPHRHAPTHRDGEPPSERPSGGTRHPPGQPEATYEPMLATSGTLGLMSGEGWAYEMKWDGIRVIARSSSGHVRLTSRTGRDVTATYPELAELGMLARGDLVVDGEVVAIGAAGHPDFGLLQRRMNLTGTGDVARLRAEVPVTLMVFDLLEVDGRDVTGETYDTRRRLLAEVLSPDGTERGRSGGNVGSPGGHSVLVPPIHLGSASAAMSASEQLGLEGIVAKRRSSPYRSGVRSADWLKVKHRRTQDVVVIGWRPIGDTEDLGAVLTAVPDASGELVFSGRVGSGFGDRTREEARGLLAPLTRDVPAVAVPAEELKGVHWVEPVLVAEVEYGEFTSSGRFRHPIWRGWRLDQVPDDVRWE